MDHSVIRRKVNLYITIREGDGEVSRLCASLHALVESRSTTHLPPQINDLPRYALSPQSVMDCLEMTDRFHNSEWGSHKAQFPVYV